MNRSALLTLTCFLTGCSILGGDPLPLYTLKSQTIEPTPVLNDTIAIDVPLSEASLNTDRIAVTLPPYQRDYLADGQWPDRLPKVVQEVLIDSLSQRWGGAHITRLSAGLQSKYILQTEIQDFSVMNLGTEKPMVHLKIMMKLVDLTGRKVLTAQTFEETMCLRSATVTGIVEGFNCSLHALIEKSIPWMESEFLKERSLNSRNDKLGRESR